MVNIPAPGPALSEEFTQRMHRAGVDAYGFLASAVRGYLDDRRGADWLRAVVSELDAALDSEGSQ